MFTDSDVALTVSDLKVRIKSMRQYSNERELNIMREECVECVKAREIDLVRKTLESVQ